PWTASPPWTLATESSATSSLGRSTLRSASGLASGAAGASSTGTGRGFLVSLGSGGGGSSGGGGGGSSTRGGSSAGGSGAISMNYGAAPRERRAGGESVREGQGTGRRGDR